MVKPYNIMWIIPDENEKVPLTEVKVKADLSLIKWMSKPDKFVVLP
jgi:hypothetical protein